MAPARSEPPDDHPSEPLAADELIENRPELVGDLGALLDAVRGHTAGRPEEPPPDFEVRRLLGEGGTAKVYLAYQKTPPRRKVALKLLPASVSAQPEILERFRREANAAGVLQHRGIAQVYSFGEWNGSVFIAMEFVEGKTLAERISDSLAANAEKGAVGPLPGDRFRFVQFAIAAARAIHHAHTHGVIHRDIKPHNIMVTPDDEVKVLDFGFAKLEGATEITLAGDSFGTPQYMSPEQIRDSREIDARADVFSLGVTLFHAVTGDAPWIADRAEAVHHKILTEDAEFPRGRSRLPGDLETILDRAMSREPSQRYATAAELADDLERYIQHEPIVARRAGWGVRARKWTRRHPVFSMTFLLVVVGLLALGAYYRTRPALLILSGQPGWQLTLRYENDVREFAWKSSVLRVPVPPGEAMMEIEASGLRTIDGEGIPVALRRWRTTTPDLDSHLLPDEGTLVVSVDGDDRATAFVERWDGQRFTAHETPRVVGRVKLATGRYRFSLQEDGLFCHPVEHDVAFRVSDEVTLFPIPVESPWQQDWPSVERLCPVLVTREDGSHRLLTFDHGEEGVELVFVPFDPDTPMDGMAEAIRRPFSVSLPAPPRAWRNSRGELRIVVSEQRALLCLDERLESVWEVPVGELTFAGAEQVDLGNGKSALLLGTRAGPDGIGFVYVIDPHAGETLGRAAVRGGVTCTPLVHDVDGTGAPEIIVSTNQGQLGCYRLGPTGLTPWWTVGPGSPFPAGFGPAPLVVEGTSRTLLLLLDRDGVAHFVDAASGEIVQRREIGLPFLSDAEVRDLDGNGIDDIVVATDDQHVCALEVDATNLEVAVRWVFRTGKTMAPEGGVHPIVVDLYGDGSLVVIVGSIDGRVIGLDGRSGSQLFSWRESGVTSRPFVFPRSRGRGLALLAHWAPDPRPGTGRLRVLAPPARDGARWRRADQLAYQSAVLAEELDAHPGPELVLASREASMVRLLDSSTGSLRAEQSISGWGLGSATCLIGGESPGIIVASYSGSIHCLDYDAATERFRERWREKAGNEVRLVQVVGDTIYAVTRRPCSLVEIRCQDGAPRGRDEFPLRGDKPVQLQIWGEGVDRQVVVQVERQKAGGGVPFTQVVHLGDGSVVSLAPGQLLRRPARGRWEALPDVLPLALRSGEEILLFDGRTEVPRARWTPGRPPPSKGAGSPFVRDRSVVVQLGSTCYFVDLADGASWWQCAATPHAPMWVEARLGGETVVITHESPTRLDIRSAPTGQLLRSLPVVPSLLHGLQVLDADGDGFEELLTTGNRGTRLYDLKAILGH